MRLVWYERARGVSLNRRDEEAEGSGRVDDREVAPVLEGSRRGQGWIGGVVAFVMVGLALPMGEWERQGDAGWPATVADVVGVRGGMASLRC